MGVLVASLTDGTGFAPVEPPPEAVGLPLAAVRAFSIDDAATTEIDDALSVQGLGSGSRLGSNGTFQDLALSGDLLLTGGTTLQDVPHIRKANAINVFAPKGNEIVKINTGRKEES